MSQSIKLNDDTFIDASGIRINGTTLAESFSLPFKCKRIEGSIDANSFTTGGVYSCNHITANAPVSGGDGNYMIVVLPWSNIEDYGHQFFIELGGTTIYHRVWGGTTFYPWDSITFS